LFLRCAPQIIRQGRFSLIIGNNGIKNGTIIGNIGHFVLQESLGYSGQSFPQAGASQFYSPVVYASGPR
jgi:hypothetical protein